jgi:serine/threonine protein kinase
MFEVYATTRYQQLELIGTGDGMNSSVFRAFDPYLRRYIAVKEISKSRFGNDFDSYCNEARTMFEVSDPNVVGIEYVCETPDHIALALPYFAKGSLKERIKDGPLALKEFMKITQGILAGVARIHRDRLLHLDLKPANILFDDSDKPLIADFGQCRRVSSSGIVRFPDVYKWTMPPEVWNTHVAIVESDIYQLGSLLYRCANGEPVYKSQKAALASTDELQRQVSRGRFPDMRFFLPHVPKRLRTIIRKAMQVAPENRYRSASDFAATLGRVPLPLNWVTRPLGGGAYSWHASRPDAPDLEVDLIPDGASSKWLTTVWTSRGTQRRAKGRTDYWTTQPTYKQACDHLTEVFAALSR